MTRGNTIQERACPRCAIKRTVLLVHGSSFCFNCRYQWDRPARPEMGMAAPPDEAFAFSVAERARLTSYRAAVSAGFYTDWPSGSQLA
jgi:hypothetical protein